jgi:hypothetical protein
MDPGPRVARPPTGDGGRRSGTDARVREAGQCAGTHRPGSARGARGRRRTQHRHDEMPALRRTPPVLLRPRRRRGPVRGRPGRVLRSGGGLPQKPGPARRTVGRAGLRTLRLRDPTPRRTHPLVRRPGLSRYAGSHRPDARRFPDRAHRGGPGPDAARPGPFRRTPRHPPAVGCRRRSARPGAAAGRTRRDPPPLGGACAVLAAHPGRVQRPAPTAGRGRVRRRAPVRFRGAGRVAAAEPGRVHRLAPAADARRVQRAAPAAEPRRVRRPAPAAESGRVQWSAPAAEPGRVQWSAPAGLGGVRRSTPAGRPRRPAGSRRHLAPSRRVPGLRAGRSAGPARSGTAGRTRRLATPGRPADIRAGTWTGLLARSRRPTRRRPARRRAGSR